MNITRILLVCLLILLIIYAWHTFYVDSTKYFKIYEEQVLSNRIDESSLSTKEEVKPKDVNVEEVKVEEDVKMDDRSTLIDDDSLTPILRT
jgi:hypothetical protein